MRSLLFSAALATSTISCGGHRQPPAPNPRSESSATTEGVAAIDPTLEAALADAVAGVRHPALRALLRDHWAWALRDDPLQATRLGVHSYDDHVFDERHEAVLARRAKTRELLGRGRALRGLDDADQLTLDLFVEGLAAAEASFVCDFHQWSLSPRSNPVTDLNELPEVHAITSLGSARQLAKRYEEGAHAVDAIVANLERGAARGLFATHESARRVLAMVHKQLAQPLDEWPMLAPSSASHPSWSEEDQKEFSLLLKVTVEQTVRPALERYATFIETQILPNARPDAKSGLVALPVIGGPCYAGRIREHTTVSLSASEIHAIGQREIERIDTELATLGRTALGTTTLPETLAKLRGDKTLYFNSAEEVEAAAQAALDSARARIPDFFGVLPKADCIVRRVPDHEAPFTTIAYYKPPHPDGSKPGEYFVNVFEPSTRPRFEARVLAFHESIPGHHLQIAIAQERPALPAFRKHGGITAFVEGWALYTERLAEDMGLYTDPLDRIGVASFDAWRAGRLVVDTGIHAMGWSRARAKEFLEAHSALSPENIDNEVDRYITWPGQALAYKLGQLEILRLRAEARAQLGERFSLPAFHDAVLLPGAVTLPVLQGRIHRYIAENEGGKKHR